MDDSGYDGGLGLTRPAVGAQRLADAEALRLLASVSYGRVVFTLKSLPAIRPVNHLLDDGRIIIRTRLTSAISAAMRSSDGVVVAYEADSIDPAHSDRVERCRYRARIHHHRSRPSRALRATAPPMGKPRRHGRRYRAWDHHRLPHHRHRGVSRTAPLRVGRRRTRSASMVNGHRLPYNAR